MKLRNLFAILIAGSMFASCSNDNDLTGGSNPAVSGKSGDIVISLSTLKSSSGTKSLGSINQAKQVPQLKNMFIFVENQGEIIRKIPLVIDTDFEQAGENITFKKGFSNADGNKTHYLIEDVVNASLSTVRVLANVTDAQIVTLTGFTKSTDLAAWLVDFSSQNQDDETGYNNAKYVLLEDKETVTDHGIQEEVVGVKKQTYLAELTVEPLVARVELMSVQLKLNDPEGAPTANKAIASFEIKNVVINNYFGNMDLNYANAIASKLFAPVALDGTTLATDVITNATTKNSLSVTDVASIDATFKNPWVAGSKFVAYNFFPTAPSLPNPMTPADEAKYFNHMPHLLIELDNIIYHKTYTDALASAGQPAPLTKGWLTIRRYFDADSENAATEIKVSQRRHVYKIAAAVFDVKNITERPYDNADIHVFVKVLPWLERNVNVVID